MKHLPNDHDQDLRLAPPFTAASLAQTSRGSRYSAYNFFDRQTLSLFRAEDLLILITGFAVIAFGHAMVAMADNPAPAIAWYFRNARLYLLISLVVLLAELSLMIVRAKPASPVKFVLSHETRHLMISRFLALAPVLAVGIMMPAFSAAKSSIGQINPFDWDDTFILIDQTIHGTDPWRLLQPVMGFPLVTYISSKLYHVWFLLIYLGPILFAIYVERRDLRLTFFLSYLATWSIVGIAAATVFSSVGPCFVGPLLGNPHFHDQMAYLAAANTVFPIEVLTVQQQLIDWYRADDAGIGRGITAMPSMHVALCWLYVLATWNLNRRLALGLALFFVITMLSSVHLGYHYAIDGYVSVVLVTLIWVGCSWLARKAMRALAASPRSEHMVQTI